MKYQVKYISTECSDKDELANRPHESVAESLYDLLKHHDEIKKPVIGLEGSWGAGKTQVIHILRKIANNREGEKFIFHTYDVWGAQEDLTRRSFLDSVLTAVKEKTGCKQLKEDYDKLNATTIKHSTKTFPTIKLAYVFIILIPVVRLMLDMVEIAFGYCNSLPWDYNQLKAVWTLAFGFSSFLCAGIDLNSEMKRLKSSSGSSSWLKKLYMALGRVVFFYNAKELEKTEFETIDRDEPSISRFKEYFGHVCESLGKNEKLVVVFDNMDRLYDPAKLMSTWSLLHTFFAEADYMGKIWAVVPFDHKQLKSLMGKGYDSEMVKSDDFISKTFFTTFRVPEPIMSSWKEFLNAKLDEAFTPRLDNNERAVVSLVFSRSVGAGRIRPRDIIAYVNRMVSVYIQHKYEEVPISAIALYVRNEKNFENPGNAILGFDGFSQMASLFEDRDGLRGHLASIYYNLPSEQALEVICDEQIGGFLKHSFSDDSGRAEVYSQLMSKEYIAEHIEEYFNKDVEYGELNVRNIYFLLERDEISLNTRERIYHDVAVNLQQFGGDFTKYDNWMEHAFLHLSPTSSRTIIKGLLRNSGGNFRAYYTTATTLLELRKQNMNLQITPSRYEAPSVNDMVEYIKYLKDNNCEEMFGLTRIHVKCADLASYLQDGKGANILFGKNADYSYDLLQVLKDNGHDLGHVENLLNTPNVNLNFSQMDVEQVRRIYRINDILYSGKSIPSFTPLDANAKRFFEIPEFLSCVIKKACEGNAAANVLNSVFSGNLNVAGETIIPILQKYITLDRLVEMALRLNNAFLKEAAAHYSRIYQRKIEKADYVLAHMTDVMAALNKQESKDNLMCLLDNNAENIMKGYPASAFDIDRYWIDNYSNENLAEHKIYAEITSYWESELDLLDSDGWASVFSKEDAKHDIVMKLEENHTLPQDKYKKEDVQNGVYKALMAYLQGIKEFSKPLFNIWTGKVGGSTLALLVNKLQDNINQPTKLEEEKLKMIVNLTISYSKRFGGSGSFSDGFYDDYFKRYISSCDLPECTELLRANKSKLKLLAMKLEKSRREEVIEMYTDKKNALEKGSSDRKLWSAFIKEISI